MQVQKFINIDQAASQLMNNTTGVSREAEGKGLSFGDILRSKTESTLDEGLSLKFSKHASIRLEDRNIQMTDGQMKRLTEGTARARDKGIKETLVMVDSLAFIVNVPNQTVVTAMDQTESDDNIFTNIDGAVIA